MNINEAKEEILDAMQAYFTKNEFGKYKIPVEKQRPVFLMGPPGIGKTAIMEQIAQELEVGLVTYSMTHHTRQSALGLPFIVKKTFGGKEYDVSEYTMSEIIASVYDMIETTGKKEGILFLDEINCVSETLAPAMLQFLQYKIFGQHKVPEGWIVVTAGNPPEFNNSVREFDIVTWDRLKRVDVEPDYDAWKEFAYKSGVHPSITTYLDIKKGDFYKIETTVDGKSFVTARGWSDLSEMIKLYEMNGKTVKERLVSQYLQNKKIAKDFAVYYDLFNKYKSDYQITQILEGQGSEEIVARAKAAKFDERLSVLGLLLDGINAELRKVCLTEDILGEHKKVMNNLRTLLIQPGADFAASIEQQISLINNNISTGKKAGTLSADNEFKLDSVIQILEEEKVMLKKENPADAKAAYLLLKTDHEKRVDKLKKQSKEAGKKLSNGFKFCEGAFEDGQEMLVFVTELTISYYASQFISHNGCEEYFNHSKGLLLYEKQKEIIKEIVDLDL